MMNVPHAAAIALSAVLLCSACVSNKAIPTIEATDYALTCEQLQAKLMDLGVAFEDAKGDSGVSAENVGLAVVFFWPGIIVNEVRANRNQDSI